jgi:crotonobetainyl-CoA:carnitine CoA-transferase CaiB-like acyl-CoA transferase
VNRIFSEFCATTGIAYETAASAAHIGAGETLPSRPATTELATGSVAAAAAAAALFARSRGASPVVTRWEVDPRRVAASFRGDQLLRLDGRAFPGFAELSGFFHTRDGWLRTHANYPHHRRRLLAALDLPEDAGREALAARLEQVGAAEAEEVVRARQGFAMAVRTREEWAAHPQSAAAAALPLLGVEELGDRAAAGPRAYRGKLRDPALPMAGLRVLDFTRVIAGPVATRTLALLGADVLRVDDPNLPELEAHHLDNGMGKRSTLLDLREPAGRGALDRLLEGADVVVTGYRRHALDAFGLAPDTLAERRPGLVVATLDAWGPTGPWSGTRGFDSIVQAATGISVLTSPDGDKPGALPAQALDHASGYLLAAGVLVALNRQVGGGGTWHVHTHLARTAQALLDLDGVGGTGGTGGTSSTGGDDRRFEQPDLGDCLHERPTPSGMLRYPPPALDVPARPFDYPSAGGVWGVDAPEWRETRPAAPGSAATGPSASAATGR